MFKFGKRRTPNDPRIACAISTSIVILILNLLGIASAQTTIVQTSSTVFPINITSPGSYILKSNLTPPLNKNAINVNVNKTTIDLNGFSISGSPTASNVWGIFAPTSGVIVRNGQLRGLCLDLGQNALVEDVIAFNCSLTDAIDVGSNSIVLRSQAVSLHSSGIVCTSPGGNNCLFADNTATGNPVNGIGCVGNGCNFSRNTANGNGTTEGNGLDCNGTGCLFTGNVSNANVGAGIATFDKTSAITNNVLNGNGFTFHGPTSLGNNLCNGSVC